MSAPLPAAEPQHEPARLSVAIVQEEVARDLDHSLERTAALARRAAAGGARLIVFPETWIPGYPAWLDVCRDAALWDHAPVKRVFRRMAENSVVVAGTSGAELADIARSCSATLVIGVCERVETGAGRGTLFNTLLTYGPGGTLLNHHRKLMPTYTERMVWGTGDGSGLQAVNTPDARVGGLICWEHWMPLARQALHEAGEDIHAAVWPTVHEKHQLCSRHYALEGRCFVLAAGSLMRASALPPELEPHPGRAPDADGWVLRGGSAIIAPDGSYLAGPVYDEPAILTADLDIGQIREESLALDVAGHYARPDVFDFRLRSNKPAPTERIGKSSSTPAPATRGE